VDKLPLDDPRWYPMKAAVDLHQQQTGDLEAAFLDLQQDLANDEIGCMRRDRAGNKRELVAASEWKPHVIDFSGLSLDGTPIKKVTQNKVADIYRRTGIDSWLYFVWKPHFDRRYLGSERVDHGDDSDTEEPLRPIDRATTVIRELWSAKAKMPRILKDAWRQVVKECQKRGWKPPSEESVQRAAEKLRYRPRRKRPTSRRRPTSRKRKR
jgi:hypothetical protein